jgi:hypothetical protein
MITMKTKLLLALAGLVCVFAVPAGAPAGDPSGVPSWLPLGADTSGVPPPAALEPAVQAAFQRESYAPGTIAALRFFNRAPRVAIQIFLVGPERSRTVGTNEMRGVPVTRRVPIGSSAPGRTVRVTVGRWPSGLYFARLDSSNGRVGFAPFVVRPRRLGEHRVAVVLPTLTWQAYNLRDDEGDGRGNSWYADWEQDFVRLYRPFLNCGVPYHFKSYDLAFLHWLVRNDKRVDFLADTDLDAAPGGEALARAYDLIVFPGHHEYVTTREYDVIEGYRDRGGNLVFLSANNFFWRVVKRGAVIERTKRWRDLGRPEAALIGVQYTGNKLAFGRYVVLDERSESWIFSGTGLQRGSRFGYGGIEIDGIAPSSPRNVRLIARIPNVFGPGRHAEMTIYRTRSGGKVFAAGSFTLAGSSECPDVSRILENLWASMTDEL